MTGLRGEIRLRVQTLQPCRQCHRQTDQVSARHRFFNLVLDQNSFLITTKFRCAPHQAQKRWKERIRGAIDEIESGGGYGHYSFEMQTQSSKHKFSPVWRVFSKIRFKGQWTSFYFQFTKSNLKASSCRTYFITRRTAAMWCIGQVGRVRNLLKNFKYFKDQLHVSSDTLKHVHTWARARRSGSPIYTRSSTKTGCLNWRIWMIRDDTIIH